MIVCSPLISFWNSSIENEQIVSFPLDSLEILRFSSVLSFSPSVSGRIRKVSRRFPEEIETLPGPLLLVIFHPSVCM